eukprot:9482346-Pyramimonas_sp.AAC.1
MEECELQWKPRPVEHHFSSASDWEDLGCSVSFVYDFTPISSADDAADVPKKAARLIDIAYDCVSQYGLQLN